MRLVLLLTGLAALMPVAHAADAGNSALECPSPSQVNNPQIKREVAELSPSSREELKNALAACSVYLDNAHEESARLRCEESVVGFKIESRACAVNWALKSALYMTGFAAANKTWSEKDVQETFWWGRCELDAVKDAYWQTWAN